MYSSVSGTLTGGWRTDDETGGLFENEFNFYELKANFRGFYPLVKSEALIFKYNGTLGHLGSTDGSIIPYIPRYRPAASTRFADTTGTWTLRARNRPASGRTKHYWVPATLGHDRLVISGTKTWINNFEIEAPIVRAAGISTVVFSMQETLLAHLRRG